MGGTPTLARQGWVGFIVWRTSHVHVDAIAMTLTQGLRCRCLAARWARRWREGDGGWLVGQCYLMMTVDSINVYYIPIRTC